MRDTMSAIEPAARPAAVLLLAVFVAGVFFVTEHEPDMPLRDNFAATADEFAADVEGGNRARQVAFLLLAAVGGLLAVRGPSVAARGDVWLAGCVLAYVAWCLASVLWSPEPGLTTRRWSVLACGFLGALGISRRLNLAQLCLMSVLIAAAYAAVGLYTELKLGTFRPDRADYRFAGTVHPNTQGMNLAILCLAGYCLLREGVPRGKGVLVAALVLAGGLLVLTRSRASLAGLLLGLAAIWLVHVPLKSKVVAFVSGGGLLSAAAAAALLQGVDLVTALETAVLLNRQDQVESLTGRLPIWNELLPYISRRPLTGYGYDSFWTPERIDAVSIDMEWGVREAHNAWIESLLSTGAVGTVLLALAALGGARRAGRRCRNTGRATDGFLTGLIAFGLLNAALESSMAQPMCAPFLMACGVMRLAFWMPAGGAAAALVPTAARCSAEEMRSSRPFAPRDTFSANAHRSGAPRSIKQQASR